MSSNLLTVGLVMVAIFIRTGLDTAMQGVRGLWSPGVAGGGGVLIK